jgi:hypothetical protein
MHISGMAATNTQPKKDGSGLVLPSPEPEAMN